METQRGQMIGILPWLVHWPRRAGTRDFSLALAVLVSSVQNIIFLTAHFFTLLVPIAQQTVSSVCVSGTIHHVSLGIQSLAKGTGLNNLWYLFQIQDCRAGAETQPRSIPQHTANALKPLPRNFNPTLQHLTPTSQHRAPT
jgi:hypothetical protein